MSKGLSKTIFVTALALFPIGVYAGNFNFDSTKLFVDNTTNEVSKSLDTQYKIEYTSKENKENEEYEELTKKTTYLLIGSGDEESPREFYSRKTEYMNMMYNPEVPKDDSSIIGLDMNSQEYKDSVVSGMVIPGMFNIFTDMEVKYDYYGNIKTIKSSDNQFISRIDIPNVRIKMSDEENPKKYKEQITGLKLFYIFKKYKNEYKLYYIYAETDDDMDDYLDKSKKEENDGVKKIENITEQSNYYDFSKLNNLSKEQIDSVYNTNIDKYIKLNSYKLHDETYNGSGFMLTKNIAVTSWSFLKKCLTNGLDVSIVNYKNDIYELEGIVSISEENDLVLIKVGGYNGEGVTIGDSDKIEIEDPVINIGTKSGYGISSNSSIVISTSGELETLIPISDSDVGGPLFNKDGQLVGVMNSSAVSSSDSFATKVTNLKEIQSKLNNQTNIKIVDYSKLQENYYYLSKNDEKIISKIPKRIWNNVEDIGITKLVDLKLVKSSYKSNIVSLRYYNNISSLLPNDIYMSKICNNLKKSGYKEILNTDNKIALENKKYKVVATNEFNYLIVLVVFK